MNHQAEAESYPWLPDFTEPLSEEEQYIYSKNSILKGLGIIIQGIEDGFASDDEIKESVHFRDFSVLKFLLLLVVSSDRINGAAAVRCLALVSSIQDSIWKDFMISQYHIDLIFYAMEFILHVITEMVNYRVPTIQRRSYHGFDKRDVKDYNMEGYEEEEELLNKQREEKQQREDTILAYLLLLNHFWLYEVDLIRQQVHITRQSNICSSADFASANTLSKLLGFSERVLYVADVIFEDGFSQCISVLISLNNQFPLLGNHRTELADMFVAFDRKNDNAGRLIQGILLMLNENGYPNMRLAEAIGASNFCYNILHCNYNEITASKETVAEAAVAVEGIQMDSYSCRGNFYTNDLKILVEISLRELTNIPISEESEDLRISYIGLLDAILRGTDWAKISNGHLKSELSGILNAIVVEDTPACKHLANIVLTEHETFLSSY